MRRTHKGCRCSHANNLCSGRDGTNKKLIHSGPSFEDSVSIGNYSPTTLFITAVIITIAITIVVISPTAIIIPNFRL